MNNKYILTYLKEFYNDPCMDRVLDYFKVDFDYYLYAYGCQFGSHDNLERSLQFMYEECGHDNDKIIIKRNRKSLLTIIKEIAYSFYSKKVNLSIEKKFLNTPGLNKKVLFVDPVSPKVKKHFIDRNILVVCLNDLSRDKYPQLDYIQEWYKSLNGLSFKERLQLERYKCLDDFIRIIQDTFSDYDGLFVGNDEYFLCKLFIDAFKGIKIPSYNWCHGIDCAYGVAARTDYQLVWGDGVKLNLIKEGKNPDHIIVSGNLHYFSVPNRKIFRNELDDILVLTSVSVANIRHSWDYDTFENWDRSLLITYIYSVENVLKKIGIKRARLRPHPINNKLWVEKFIDTSFYEIDNLPLDKSLEKATLAIGPTSSTFVEALREGVNYLVYEPGENGRSIIGMKLTPPFDGSDDFLKVAFSEEQLEFLIESHYSCNPDIIKKYMVPFNIDSFIHTLRRKEDNCNSDNFVTKDN